MSVQPNESTAAAAAGTVSSMMGLVTTVQFYLMLEVCLSYGKEKWDSSGGNEMLGRVSASIPQGTKDSLMNASNNLFNRQHLRSFTLFFGMGEERPFYVEKSPVLLTARLKHNVKFFYLNYMIVFAILFVLTMITSFTTMIGLVCLGGAWLYVIKASEGGTLSLGAIQISQKIATLGMSGVSVLVLFWLLSNIFWWTIGSGGFLCTVHGVLRDASMHQDEDDRVDMSGDLTLDESTENAAFLNPVEGSAIDKV